MKIDLDEKRVMFSEDKYGESWSDRWGPILMGAFTLIGMIGIVLMALFLH